MCLPDLCTMSNLSAIFAHLSNLTIYHNSTSNKWDIFETLQMRLSASNLTNESFKVNLTNETYVSEMSPRPLICKVDRTLRTRLLRDLTNETNLRLSSNLTKEMSLRHLRNHSFVKLTEPYRWDFSETVQMRSIWDFRRTLQMRRLWDVSETTHL